MTPLSIETLQNITSHSAAYGAWTLSPHLAYALGCLQTTPKPHLVPNCSHHSEETLTTQLCRFVPSFSIGPRSNNSRPANPICTLYALIPVTYIHRPSNRKSLYALAPTSPSVLQPHVQTRPLQVAVCAAQRECARPRGSATHGVSPAARLRREAGVGIKLQSGYRRAEDHIASKRCVLRVVSCEEDCAEAS
jgi:hypothetical protein